MDQRVEKLRKAVHQGIPRNWAGRRLRHVLDLELKHVEVNFSEEQLCRVGRMVQHALAFASLHLNIKLGDDIVGLVDAVLDELGCPE